MPWSASPPEAALAQAAAADAARKAGKAGTLTGVPMIHKDIFCTAGVLTTCALEDAVQLRGAL